MKLCLPSFRQRPWSRDTLRQVLSAYLAATLADPVIWYWGVKGELFLFWRARLDSTTSIEAELIARAAGKNGLKMVHYHRQRFGRWRLVRITFKEFDEFDVRRCVS